MNNTWFTADTHFGHANILGFEPNQRPFNTVEEMNEVLIEKWNSVVREKDTVYHLGDVAFGKHSLPLIKRLNGKKRLCLGNHDGYVSSEYLLYFEKLYGAKEWKKCILTHVPVHPGTLGTRFLLNVHGHLHSKNVGVWLDETIFVPDRNYLCVSVEQNNLYPVHADIIRDRLRILEG